MIPGSSQGIEDQQIVAVFAIALSAPTRAVRPGTVARDLWCAGIGLAGTELAISLATVALAV